ncbi:hypothetical protein L2Y90_01580 [Burkholderia pyrrocinia]|uniref:hypothetical protein n=1 Tax=Burkholderia pyrrocinia TaxID=60550 RepID=UPI00215B12EE|nr:hypothetical protein [Burkholderia pyrrocinia]UVE65846.1 hypothetical protein L2Y90_01580 [Burkholderia pyrrocinia]
MLDALAGDVQALILSIAVDRARRGEPVEIEFDCVTRFGAAGFEDQGVERTDREAAAREYDVVRAVAGPVSLLFSPV